MSHHSAHATHQSGMSLIEVLVSLLIFSFAFLGLMSMQSHALQTSTDAEDRNRAALLANEIISTMWTQKTTTLPATTIIAWQAKVSDQTVSGLPNSTGEVNGPYADGVVKVSITWRAPSRNATVQRSQYVTQVMMP